MNEIIIIFAAAFIAYLCGKSYIFLWNRKKISTNTPSGFGMLLPLFVLIYILINFLNSTNLLAEVLIIFIAGLIYWLDDIFDLSAVIRVFIAFFSGVILMISLYSDVNLTPFAFMFFSVGFGIFAVALTNSINFYDGNDLNLATIVFLTGIVLLFFSDIHSSEIANIGAVMIGFSIGFGFINRTPFSLYLGDSGAFVLSLFFLLFFINYLFNLSHIPLELMFVLALPIFDVFYVLLIRLYYKHDLLSRNYLHLYQRINIIYGSFFHLIPQIINFSALLILGNWIESLGILRFWAFFFTSVIFTPIFYLISRALLVERNYFFGDGESNES